MSVVLYNVAQLVGEMTVLVVLNRTGLRSHPVLGSSSSPVCCKIVRLLIVRVPTCVGSEGGTPPLAVPRSP